MALAITTSPATKVSKPAESDGYEYAAATVHYHGMYYRFYCSAGLNSDPHMQHPDTSHLKRAWDYVRMRTSTDGTTWSTASVAITPTIMNADSCACDPAIIRDGSYWYLYYAGYIDSLHTVTYVARSQNIKGPYKRYTKRGTWEQFPADPQPILTTKTKPQPGLAYGAAQVSVVKKDGKFHFWFTDVTETPADPNVNKVWKYTHIESTSPYKNLQKKHLENSKEISLDGKKRFITNDFGDVKWNPVDTVFEMWITTKHFFWNDYIHLKKYVSRDGNSWTSRDSVGPFSLASNVGMSGDSIGWLKEGKSLVTFAAPDAGCDLTKAEIDALRNRQEQLSHHAPGLPLSTYQFVDGKYVKNSISIVADDSTRVVVGKDAVYFKYYQFPVKSNNIKFIAGDYDGDGVTDIGAVACSDSCRWYIRSSRTGGKGVTGIPWGWVWPGMNKNHTIVNGDFDGDGKTDRAIVDKSAKMWYIFSSKMGPYDALVLDKKNTTEKDTIWGWLHPDINQMTHILTGDYDGDGKSDIGAVDCSMEISEGGCRWYIRSSQNGDKGVPLISWGWKWPGMVSNHIVLEGDYDGDRRTDRTIVNGAYGYWYTYTSRTNGQDALSDLFRNYPRGNNTFVDTVLDIWQWKLADMNADFVPIVGDFNGDGTADRAMVSKIDFRWTASVILHSPGYFDFLHYYFTPLKQVIKNNYQILVGDYDGDATSDCILVDKKTSKIYFYTSRFRGNAFVLNNYYINLSPNSMKKTHFTEPSAGEEKIQSMPKTLAKFSTENMDLVISDMEAGSEIGVFNMMGQRIFGSRAASSTARIQLSSKGMYIVRVGSQSSLINVK